LLRNWIAAVLLVLPCLVAAAGQPSVEDIEECVARNLPEASGTLDFAVRAVDREGGSTDSGAQLLWRRGEDGLSRVVLRITEPAKTAGTSVLMREQEDDDPELFVYLPATKKVKRVRKSRLRGSLFGTDFSYEDFERIQGLADVPRLELREDFELEGRQVWVLEARPEDRKSSEYSRVISYVDQEYCLPLRMEFVDWKGSLRKVMDSSADTVRREGERFLPEEFVMRDLRDRTETRVAVRGFAIDPGHAEAQFTQQALPESPR
jgi:hypothetical protein